MSEMVMLGGNLAKRHGSSLFDAQLQNLLGVSKFLADGVEAPPVALWATVDAPR
jgi:hypothetical protein